MIPLMDTRIDLLRSLKRFYEAETRYSMSGLAVDRAALLETVHSDVVLHQPDSLPYGGQWKGREDFGRWLDAFVGTWSNIVPSDAAFHNCGGEVLVATVVMRATARTTGMHIEMPMCQVIRFSDNLPIDWRNFAWDTAILLDALRNPVPPGISYELTG